MNWFQVHPRKTKMFSEAMGRVLELHVARSVLKRMDTLGGLDNYLLQTPDEEINSKVGISLKRKVQQLRGLPVTAQFTHSPETKEDDRLGLYEFAHYQPTKSVDPEVYAESFSKTHPRTKYLHQLKMRQFPEKLWLEEHHEELRKLLPTGRKPIGFLNLPRDRRFTVFPDPNVPDKPYWLSERWAQGVIQGSYFRHRHANQYYTSCLVRWARHERKQRQLEAAGYNLPLVYENPQP